MEISPTVCQQIAKIDPNCRIGYGAKPGFPPSFCIIKLYPFRDMERSLYAPDEWHSRGPIFSKKGRVTPDWDLLSRIPCNLADVSATLIYTGDVVETLKSWVVDVRDSQYNALVKMAKEENAGIEDLSRKMADYAIWHNRQSFNNGEYYSQPTDSTTEAMARYSGDGEKNHYWQEVADFEAKHRPTGWRPPQERS